MNPRAYFCAFGAITLWATLAVLALRLSAVPPFLLVGSGLTLGGICGIPWIRQWKVPRRTLVMGIYGLFGYHFFLFMAFRNAPAVEANLINYMWPLLLVLLSPVFFKDYQLKLAHLLAAIFGFVGAILIVTGGKLALPSSGLIGYSFAGLAAVVWATYSLLTKKVPPFPTASVGLFCLVSGLAALLCHFLIEPKYVWSIHELPFLGILGLGPMGAAFFLWDQAVKLGDPRVIGSLSFLTPMFSTLLLIAAGRGTLIPASGLAMILILGSAWLGSSASRVSKPKLAIDA